MQLTISAAIKARWGHRVDGLIHTHAWTLEATVSGPADAPKVYPADNLEAVLHDVVEPWQGNYLTHEDVGHWKGYDPLLWENEPTVEEICRVLWAELETRLPDLIRVSLTEADEFDRHRTVALTALRS